MGRKTKGGVELRLARCTVREWRPGDAPSLVKHANNINATLHSKVENEVALKPLYTKAAQSRKLAYAGVVKDAGLGL